MARSQSKLIEPKDYQQQSTFIGRLFVATGKWPVPEICAFLITVIVMLLHRKLTQPEGGDSAIWDYVAQCILRGQVPYRDVVEIKSPLSAYLSAAAMFIGKSVGLRDVIAVRLLNIVMAGLLSAAILRVGDRYLRNRFAAAIAFVIPLMPSHFVEWVLGGTEPKLPMIMFGMLSLLCIAKRKPFWAGFLSMLSCLCWQPGLLFTAVALLVFSRYLTSWRDQTVVKVIAGAAIPLLALVSYFISVGALSDLWSWTVAFDLKVYAPQTATSLSETLATLLKVSIRAFRFDLLFVALAVAGLIVFSLRRAKERLNHAAAAGDPMLYLDGLVLAPLVYLIFCLINFQSGPDLIPLFPFIGLFAAYLILKLSSLSPERQFAQLVPRLALIALLAVALLRATNSISAGETLRDQDLRLSTISKSSAPDDRMYVHGMVEILVLLNKPNMNPYIFLDRGKDDWIAKRRGIEFRDIIAEMESQAPKIVAVSRLGKVAHRQELERWIDEHYAKALLSGLDGVYIRKQ